LGQFQADSGKMALDFGVGNISLVNCGMEYNRAIDVHAPNGR
jgi:hypothetical protein